MYMTNIIDDAYIFIMSNLDNIILVTLFMFIGLVYVVVNNIKLNPRHNIHPVTKRVIIYEGFDNKTDIDTKQETKTELNEEKTFNTTVCDKLQGKSHEIETHCSNLNNDLCKFTKCCILGHDADAGTMKCVAGNRIGPTYHETDDNVPRNFDYWYYKNKCYGDKTKCSDE